MHLRVNEGYAVHLTYQFSIITLHVGLISHITNDTIKCIENIGTL